MSTVFRVFIIISYYVYSINRIEINLKDTRMSAFVFSNFRNFVMMDVTLQVYHQSYGLRKKSDRR